MITKGKVILGALAIAVLLIIVAGCNCIPMEDSVITVGTTVGYYDMLKLIEHNKKQYDRFAVIVPPSDIIDGYILKSEILNYKVTEVTKQLVRFEYIREGYLTTLREATDVVPTAQFTEVCNMDFFKEVVPIKYYPYVNESKIVVVKATLRDHFDPFNVSFDTREECHTWIVENVKEEFQSRDDLSAEYFLK